jgi:hypothetical protein
MKLKTPTNVYVVFSVPVTRAVVKWDKVTALIDDTPIATAGYKVYGGLNQNGTDMVLLASVSYVDTDGATAPIFEDGIPNELTDGLQYFYRVSAYDKASVHDESDLSSIVSST